LVALTLTLKVKIDFAVKIAGGGSSLNEWIAS
jgi:hypothetical protein